MPIVDKGQVNKDAPRPEDLEAKHHGKQGEGHKESDAKTDLGKPLIPAEAATERGRDNPMGVKCQGRMPGKEGDRQARYARPSRHSTSASCR